MDLSKISEQLTSMSEQAEKNRVARVSVCQRAGVNKGRSLRQRRVCVCGCGCASQDLANDRFKQAQKELELMSSIIYKIGIESYRKLLTVPAPGPDMVRGACFPRLGCARQCRGAVHDVVCCPSASVQSVLNRHRSQMSPMRALPQ